MQLRLSLTELDRRFAYLSEGRTYHGEAVNPKGLSLWERMMGFSKVCAHLLKPVHLPPHSLDLFTYSNRNQPSMEGKRPSPAHPGCGSCQETDLLPSSWSTLMALCSALI